jgi:hypothetical protein
VTSRNAYLWSVALFCAALFSKQNTITLAPALVLFDVIVDRRRPSTGAQGVPSVVEGRIELSWKWIRPYVPYVLLTAGFLLLRYVLFHEVAREGVLSTQRFREFISDSSRHLARLVFGGAGLRPWAARDTIIVSLASIAVAFIAARASGADVRRLWRPAMYFGVIWVAFGMAPILVSGYYSPRHMYLASLGWAVTLGIALDILWRARPVRYARVAAALGAAALLIAYAAQLRDVVRDWNSRAAISYQALVDLEQEAMNNPDGTLILVGVPTASWAFAVPLALRPPFTRTDLTRRVLVVSDSSLHCCPVSHWNEYTRQALQAWHGRAERAPVVAMYWDGRTGRLSRVSDNDDPQLRTLISLIVETDSRETLDSAIRGLLKNFVAVR